MIEDEKIAKQTNFHLFQKKGNGKDIKMIDKLMSGKIRIKKLACSSNTTT